MKEREPRFVVYRDAAGEYRWRLVATNGRIIATSSDGYTEHGDAHEAVERVKRLVNDINARAGGVALEESGRTVPGTATGSYALDMNKEAGS